jgi:exoribonuclease R
VEEFMLLANILIGKHLYKYFKNKTLLRVHEDIKGEKRNKLQIFLQKAGLHSIDLQSGKYLSNSIEELRKESSD